MSCVYEGEQPFEIAVQGLGGGVPSTDNRDPPPSFLTKHGMGQLDEQDLVDRNHSPKHCAPNGIEVYFSLLFFCFEINGFFWEFCGFCRMIELENNLFFKPAYSFFQWF